MQPVAAAESPWFTRFHPAPQAAVRLVCFPHAGGAAGAYTALSRALRPDVDVLSVQYPGRQNRRREPFVESVPELADAAFRALRPHLPGPYALFGHSLGAVVAFEVARLLEERTAVGPLRLFASARRAPSVVRDEQVHLRDDAGLVAEMRRLSGTDQGVLDDEEILAFALPAVRADYKAVETYRCPPGARVSCPVTVLVGDADPVTSTADAAAWRGHSAGGVRLRVLPGGHFYLDRQVARVADEIRAALREPPR